MKKYELTTDTKIFLGRKLFRIKALISFGNVEAGDMGGYIEKESNLSHNDNAWVSDNAQVYGNAWVYGDAQVYGNARVYGDAQVYGNAQVCGNAWVCDDACVYGNAQVCGNAWVNSDDDYLYVKGLGSVNRETTFFKCSDGHIHVSCGCFNGNLDEFSAQVKETHGDSKYAKEYLAAVEVVKIHFGEDNNND